MADTAAMCSRSPSLARVSSSRRPMSSRPKVAASPRRSRIHRPLTGPLPQPGCLVSHSRPAPAATTRGPPHEPPRAWPRARRTAANPARVALAARRPMRPPRGRRPSAAPLDPTGPSDRVDGKRGRGTRGTPPRGAVAPGALRHHLRRGPGRCGQAGGGCRSGRVQVDGLLRAQVRAAPFQVRQDAHGERSGHPDDLGPVTEAV